MTFDPVGTSVTTAVLLLMCSVLSDAVLTTTVSLFDSIDLLGVTKPDRVSSFLPGFSLTSAGPQAVSVNVDHFP